MSKQDTATSDLVNSLLLDQEVQAMIQQMVDQGSYFIVPQVGERGISYPSLTKILQEKSDPEKRDFLQTLANAKILNSKLLDKVIVCPSCGSPAVYSKYNCPRCSSFNIGKATIIEHIKCGYIASYELFKKSSILFCPNCKTDVGESDYRKIGTGFICNSCGSRFESPKISHKCNSCEDLFTYKEAKYEPIFQYELTEEAKRSIAKGTLPLSSLVAFLRQRGFEVALKKDLIGKSGASHIFDIVARRGAELIVGNFTFEPKEEDIIGLFAKKYDIDPSLTLLLALTSASKEEEAVARAYGVKILSSGGQNSLVHQTEALIT
ncbi:MAG: TackOD1 domain-containing metal-binding protein [Nitrososphaerales archaeon]